MAECPEFQHDFKPDPVQRPNWRDSTCTCTRCGQVRNALTGRVVEDANDR